MSFISCLIISFYYIDVLFLVEAFPFNKFLNKKFIVTHTTELINVIWYLMYSTASFSVYPFFFYQLIQFSKTSWYGYQIVLAQKLFLKPLIIYYVFITICYTKLFPEVLQFLIHWQLNQSNSLIKISIEFKMLSYTTWILVLRYTFGFLIYSVIVLLIQSSFVVTIKNIYDILKYHRKKALFLNILILFLLVPPDLLLQFTIISISFTLHELWFIIICYKVCTLKYKL